MMLWIDDLRNVPEGYSLVARTANEAIALFDLHKDEITHISFDHDLGTLSVDENGEEMSGYHFACYIEEKLYTNQYDPKNLVGIQVHSSNSSGSQRIIAFAENIKQRFKKDLVVHYAPYESLHERDRFGCMIRK